MAYDLFFHNDGAVLGFTMRRADWESVSVTRSEMTEGIKRYLGKYVRWHDGEDGKLGYRGCAVVEKTENNAAISVALHGRNVRESMLTLSFLLQDIAGMERGKGKPESYMMRQLHIGCGPHHSLFGYVSEGFRQGLACLEVNDLEIITKDMRRAWRATAIRPLKKYSDECYARIHDQRFELGCFGDACDAGMYPDSDLMFSCHNLDTPYQQATLVAGLASLYERVKLKM